MSAPKLMLFYMSPNFVFISSITLNHCTSASMMQRHDTTFITLKQSNTYCIIKLLRCFISAATHTMSRDVKKKNVLETT